MSEREDHLRQVICRMQESRNDLVSTLRQAARQLGYALVPLEAGADQHAGSEGMSELLPCPFCGSTDLEVNEHSYISCRSCDADGPIHCANTVAAWNRRATLPCWIPVEERLPEEGDEVLLFVPMYNECHVAAWQDGMGVREDGACFDPSPDPEIGFTHWMPLPAPPTQTDERAQQALDDIDLARKFPVQGGFIEEQPSGWYPCRSAAPGSSTSSPAPTQEEQE